MDGEFGGSVSAHIATSDHNLRSRQKRGRYAQLYSHAKHLYEDGASEIQRHLNVLHIDELRRLMMDGCWTKKDRVMLETVILGYGRPVCAIVAGKVHFSINRSDYWFRKSEERMAEIARTASSVGRLEVRSRRRKSSAEELSEIYIGTCFAISGTEIKSLKKQQNSVGLVATCRHVAELVCDNNGNIRDGLCVSVDFVEEMGRDLDEEHRVIRVAHIDEDWDFALLEVEAKEGYPCGAELVNQESEVEFPCDVFLVGYPSLDDRNDHTAIPDSLRTDLKLASGVKRFAPGRGLGRVAENGGDYVYSDYTSFGGNSGSPLCDLGTGKVIGIHFGGRLGGYNYAVPSWVIGRVVTRILERHRTDSQQPEDTGIMQSTVGTMHSWGEQDFLGALLSERARCMTFEAARIRAKSFCGNMAEARSAERTLDAAAAFVVLTMIGALAERRPLAEALARIRPELQLGLTAAARQLAPIEESVALGGARIEGPEPWMATVWLPNRTTYQSIQAEGLDSTCIASTLGGALVGAVSGGPMGPWAIAIRAIGSGLMAAATSGCFD